jgi:hypothetical protein
MGFSQFNKKKADNCHAQALFWIKIRYIAIIYVKKCIFAALVTI